MVSSRYILLMYVFCLIGGLWESVGRPGLELADEKGIELASSREPRAVLAAPVRKEALGGSTAPAQVSLDGVLYAGPRSSTEPALGAPEEVEFVGAAEEAAAGKPVPPAPSPGQR